MLQAIASRRGNTEVAFYSPARLLSKETLAQIDESLKTRKILTKVTYYRILAADLLPADAHRALYIDADVVCTGGLGELFALDMKGLPLGMCFYSSHISVYNRLGYPPAEGYFNSGVVLMDLDLWRSGDIDQALLAYFSLNAKKLLSHDQDLLNAALHGKIFQLGLEYNVVQKGYYVFYWLDGENNGFYAGLEQYLPKDRWEELRAAVERPRLVHIHGNMKPWHRESDDPFAPVWRYFYAQSPWKGERLKRYTASLSAKEKLKYYGRRALERLDLISPAHIPFPKEAYASGQRVLDELIEGDKS